MLNVFLRRSLVPHHQISRYFSNKNSLKTLAKRGMINDVFPKDSENEIASFFSSGSRAVYAGFDPTADSLHIGNLLILLGLIHCQRDGHKVIVLLGGATARIGDPSGKTAERPMMKEEVLNKNIDGIKADIGNIFYNHEKYFWTPVKSSDVLNPVEVVNNETWYSEMNIIQFLSTVGRHFRMGTMLLKQSVKSRLESDQGLSLTEFTYQTFQAYDWLHLFKERDCRIQLGGSDQMGNLAAGQELISRDRDQQVYGVTLPLVVSESGHKLGKSAGAPVWLSARKTSPFDFYQYFIRLPDADMEKMLTFFTFLPRHEVEALLARHRARPEKREAQEALARNLTLLIHGQEGLDLAIGTTDVLYNNDTAALGKMTLDQIRQIFGGAAYLQRLYQPGISVIEMCNKIGCFRTERDAVRIITAGGLYINQARVTNTEEALVPGIHIMENDITLVRVGKRNYYIVEWT